MKTKRTRGLLAIVIYKCFVASLLVVTSLAILLTLKNYENLVIFSKEYVLETKYTLIQWLVDQIVNISPIKLKLSGIVTAVYAIVTAIEAIGLWYQKSWATVLVIGLVGISIPPEIFELIKGITPLKLIVLMINVAILWYLITHFSKHKKTSDN